MSSLDKLDFLLTRGLKMTTLGRSVEEFISKPFSPFNIIIYAIMTNLFLLPSYMIYKSFEESDNAVDFLLTAYVSFQFFCYSFQWGVWMLSLKKIIQIGFKFNDYNCSLMDPKKSVETVLQNLPVIDRIWKFYFGLMVVATGLYIIYPLLEAAVLLAMGSPIEILEVYPSEFAFGVLTSPLREVVYFMQSFTVIAAFMVSYAILSWSLTYAYGIFSQLTILQNSITLYKDTISMEEFVNDHQKITEVMHSFLEVFQPLVATKLVFCLYLLTAASFLAASLDDPGTFLMNLAGDLAMGLYELTVFCMVGSYLKEKYEATGFAVYSSPWVETPQQSKTATLMVSCRSQHSFRPRAFFGLVKIEAPTIIDILQMAYSYYTLLSHLTLSDGPKIEA